MFNFIYKLKSSEICLKKKIKHKIVNTKSPFEISLFFTKVCFIENFLCTIDILTIRL